MDLLSEFNVGMTVGLSGYCRTLAEYCRILSDKPVGLSDRGSARSEPGAQLALSPVRDKGTRCMPQLDSTQLNSTQLNPRTQLNSKLNSTCQDRL